MPMIVKELDQSNFIPCPEGFWNAVCVDVIDIGLVKTQWGEKHKLRICWETEQLMPDTHKPFLVNNMYSMSLDSRSELRKMLENWRAAKLTPEELKNGFDLDRLLGVPCQVQVVQSEKDGKIFANVKMVAPLSKDMKPLKASGQYVRVQDRTEGNEHHDDNDTPTF